MTRTHTLTTIAKEFERDRRTVQNWYTKAKAQNADIGELIDGTRYFNEQEKAILLSFKGEDRKVIEAISNAEATTCIPEIKVSDTFFQPTEMTVYKASEVILPEAFDPNVLAAHFDGAVSDAVDTDGLLNLVETMLNTAVDTVNRKIEKQEARLRKDKQNLEVIKDVADEKMTELKIAGRKSKQLSERQNAVTASVTGIAEQIAVMGKPQATDGNG